MQPELVQSDAASSLLSLSIAAATAVPIPIAEPSLSVGDVGSLGVNGSQNVNHTTSVSPPLSTSIGTAVKQHRRLSSTGKARRRLSDARDAANRPSPAVMQTAAALSLASLSLSSSPPLGSVPQLPTSFTAVSNTLTSTAGLQVQGTDTPSTMPLNDGVNIPSQPPTTVDGSKGNIATPIPISTGKSGRKRGMDHKCESCSKIYRHPSCLIKHRWEHTPHWREASKFVLSKHQQVQLLEAAAILSHLSPSSSTGTSLPDDRSLWPSFLSGGSLPKADEVFAPGQPGSVENSGTSVPTSSYPSHPVSSSVPANAIGGNFNRSTSAGPRLHDYSIPTSGTGSGGATQLRPGLIGVPTGPAAVAATPSKPVPVPHGAHATSDSFKGYRSPTSDPWAFSPYENGHISSSYVSTGGSLPYAHSDERSAGTGAGGWSLPRSSLRSVSASSKSRSRSGSASGSRSDDESLEVDVDGDLEVYSSTTYGLNGRGRRGVAWKREEDDMSIGFSVREEDEGDDDVVVNSPMANRKEPEWDGLEMDMDMD